MYRVRTLLPAAIQWRSWLMLTGLTAVAGWTAHLIVPDAPSLVPLLVKGTIFCIAWVVPALFVRPLAMHDADVFGRSLAFLQRPMAMLSRREASA